MKAIVGLGNPGMEYRETRHNVGFLAVDFMADQLKLDFRSKFQGLLAEGNLNGNKVLLFKPQTFMNLSGRAVRELSNFYKLKSEDIIVVHDDMDLPLGKIRLRPKGGAGGHNGIKSVMGELGTDQFWRLRMGIGRPPAYMDPARYVLASFLNDEIPALEDVLQRSKEALQLWSDGEENKAMNLYNQ